MIQREGETYLVAAEAARHLGISRMTFYRRYKALLTMFQVGELARPHYRISELEKLHSARPITAAS